MRHPTNHGQCGIIARRIVLLLLLGTAITSADERNVRAVDEPATIVGPVDLLQDAEEEARYFQNWIANDLSAPWMIRRPDPSNPGVELVTAEEAHEILNRILFGPLSAGDDDARSRLELILQERIQLIDRLCGLSEIQTRKLRLAGRGDAHRLFERIASLRESLPRIVERGVTIDFAREMRDIYHLIRVGTIDERSKFAKCLRKVLTSEQVVIYSQKREEVTPGVRELLLQLKPH